MDYSYTVYADSVPLNLIIMQQRMHVINGMRRIFLLFLLHRQYLFGLLSVVVEISALVCISVRPCCLTFQVEVFAVVVHRAWLRDRPLLQQQLHYV